MIPTFPEFKKLELSDRTEVEKITKRFQPYSDFNFISMWSWDVKKEMGLSVLNDNLVVRFSEYLTGEPFYSFLGTQKVDETAERIINLSTQSGLSPDLSLVPELAVSYFDVKKFSVSEQRDQFDYIFDLRIISELKGSKFSNKRNLINKITSEGKIRSEKLNLHDPEIRFNIKKLNLEWLEQKKKRDPYFEIKNELIATDKFLESEMFENVVALGVFMETKMVGYTISEILSNGYAMSHFTKADFSKRGVYEYIMQENAKLLQKEGVEWLNYEQDLGLPGLKESKEGFSTGIFLKQYKVVLK